MADPRLAQAPNVVDAIRVGVIDLEVAPLGTAYNSTTAWERIGTIEPGSFKLETEREMFDIMRGLPKALVKSVAIGMKGSASADLGEYTGRAVELANGGLPLVRTTTNATTTTAAALTTTTCTLTLATGYAVGKWVAITIASLGKTFDRKITAINGSVITFEALPTAPAAGDAVSIVTAYQVAGGGVSVQQFSARAVFTDTNGDQAIMHFPKVQSSGKFAPTFDPEKNAIIPLELTLYGVQSTVNGTTDYFLYQHYIIPA